MPHPLIEITWSTWTKVVVTGPRRRERGRDLRRHSIRSTRRGIWCHWSPSSCFNQSERRARLAEYGLRVLGRADQPLFDRPAQGVVEESLGLRARRFPIGARARAGG